MHWLYRYIFRGIGVVFVIGMITVLALAIVSQMRRPAAHAPINAARHARSK